MKLFPLPGNEAPAGLTADALKTPDGASLRYALARPQGAARGTVCILPGRTEYIEKYFETIEELLARQFAVAIIDWRGQGLSDRLLRNRLKGHIASFAQHRADLDCFMRDVVLPDCPPPYFALGNSAGGAVLLDVLCERTWFSRAVAISPMIALAERRLPVFAIRVTTRLACAIGLAGAYVPGARRRLLRADDFPGNPFTSDSSRFLREVRTLEAAPELGLAGPTFGWLAAALRQMDRLASMPKSATPRANVLIVAAGNDRIVSLEASHAFARRVPKVACVVAEQARHEVLLESDEIRAQFWAAFDSFIDAQEPHTPPQPASTAAASA